MKVDLNDPELEEPDLVTIGSDVSINHARICAAGDGKESPRKLLEGNGEFGTLQNPSKGTYRGIEDTCTQFPHSASRKCYHQFPPGRLDGWRTHLGDCEGAVQVLCDASGDAGTGHRCALAGMGNVVVSTLLCLPAHCTPLALIFTSRALLPKPQSSASCEEIMLEGLFPGRQRFGGAAASIDLRMDGPGGSRLPFAAFEDRTPRDAGSGRARVSTLQLLNSRSWDTQRCPKNREVDPGRINFVLLWDCPGF